MNSCNIFKFNFVAKAWCVFFCFLFFSMRWVHFFIWLLAPVAWRKTLNIARERTLMFYDHRNFLFLGEKLYVIRATPDIHAVTTSAGHFRVSVYYERVEIFQGKRKTLLMTAYISSMLVRVWLKSKIKLIFATHSGIYKSY